LNCSITFFLRLSSFKEERIEVRSFRFIEATLTLPSPLKPEREIKAIERWRR
jgi:hypothetical protein